MSARLAAITGATGFLGRHLVAAVAARGWRVRVLARRDPVDPLWRGLEPQVVPGSLEDPRALAQLCDGAEVVIHAAGLIKARSAEAFQAANAAGARRMAEAAKAAGAPHFVLISSLAAREPQLSEYAASKRAGEARAQEVVGDRLTIVRPPAVYGPGDRETFGLFKAAQDLGVLPIFDPAARIALIHVEDAAAQVAALAESRADLGRIVALSDDRPEGYGWREIAEGAGAAIDRPVRVIQLPDGVLTLLGAAAELVRRLGGAPILSAGKARELRHADWSVPRDQRPSGPPTAKFGLEDGFRHTVTWYQGAGWLRS